MRQTARSSDVRIVPTAKVTYDGLTFSPDGNYVYYNTYPRPGGRVATLYRIPALGGTPTTLLEDVDSAVAFSPDGKQMAFTRGMATEGTTLLMSAAADGSGVRSIASLPLPDKFQSERFLERGQAAPVDRNTSRSRWRRPAQTRSSGVGAMVAGRPALRLFRAGGRVRQGVGTTGCWWHAATGRSARSGLRGGLRDISRRSGCRLAGHSDKRRDPDQRRSESLIHKRLRQPCVVSCRSCRPSTSRSARP